MTAAACPRLELDLDVLRIALGTYLECVRMVWKAAPESASDVEVQRLVASVGARPLPGDAALAHVGMLLDAPSPAGDPLLAIASTLELTRGEELALAASWWADADPQFAILLGCAHDDAARRHASAALMRIVLAPFGIELAPSVDDEGPLVRGGVLEAGAGAASPLRATATARLLLAGGRPRAMRASDPAPDRFAGVQDALARRLAAGGDGVVLLRGPAGVGRRAVAIDAARAAGLAAIEPRRPAAELKLLARLRIAVTVAPAADVAALEWSDDDGPLVAWGTPTERVAGARTVELRAPTHAQRARSWRLGLAASGLADADADADADALAASLAARFSFTEGDVHAVLRQARDDATWHGRALDGAGVWDAARRRPEHALAQLATLIAPVFTLDDLVLSDQTEAQLRELVSHVELQHRVLDGWGFRRRLPRGQGVAALFTGPPGTGKTTAAEALASELGQDLYRIDLSAVVSKYIGETEKNLGTAFDEAERSSAVLFFDEADALFGKRTETRDAHDRYANLEVSYLLQRVETFTGLVILASNRQSAIDDAFLRRLRFVIRFDAPDAALRRRLWRRSFPAEASLGALDWDGLASAELAGGHIQSSALSAAYLAAADGGVITAEHLERALEREHEKLGKAWSGTPARSPR